MSIIDTENKEVIIVGDLNLNYLKSSDHLDIKQTFTVNGYSQLIKKPTRITSTTATLIDVIQTTQPSNITKSVVVPADLSDHDMVGCVRKLHNLKSKPKTIKCRNFTRYDANTVCKELHGIQYNNLYTLDCPEKAWHYLKSILVTTLDKYTPYISKRVKGKTCPWLNANVKNEMNDRDRLLRIARKSNREIDWSSYKRKRNYVINLIKRSKKSHFTNLLNESASNSDKFWKSLKQIFPTKGGIRRQTTSFMIDGKETRDKNVIANGFCKFLSSVASTLKSKAFPLTNHVWKYTPTYENRTNHVFSFRHITTQEVVNHLKKLKRNKAVGLDSLPPGYLKDVADVIAKPLTHVINLSLSTGIIPNDFKCARITPLHKSGPINNIDNYRPISVLPSLSKVLERCVHTQVMSYLESNNLLSVHQFGFRKQRSTELAATCFIDHVRKSMDQGELTGTIYIDLSKAFDTISHGAIIAKLPRFGIVGTPQE